MTRKVIISEEQLRTIADFIQENEIHQTLVRRIGADLDLNYEPQKGTYKKGGEFYEEPMVMNIVSQELMTAKSLFEYMKFKYKMSGDFIKQIIDDWYNGNLDASGTLSKNISAV